METYDMRVNYLTKKQIDYELRIREVVTKKDVNVKRKMLKKLLEKEQASKKIVLDPDFNFDTEKLEIGEICDSTRNLIEEFEAPESDSGYIRIKTYLIHVIHRVNRIISKSEDADLTAYILNFKSESKATCLELEALLSEKVQTPEHADNTMQLNSSIAHNTVLIPSTSQTIHKSVPVYKWDLKFNGEKNSSLKSFLERVDELCASRNVSKTELFASACDLFSGNALLWFRSIKNSISDWDSLVALLNTEFLPSNYDDQLWEDICNRKMGRHESITIFIAIMETLFSRLSKPPPEITKLKYIRKNLLPDYISQLALTQIMSINRI